jgi:hypothetical protein
LKPYWGKPTVRNFRGGRGNEMNGLMTFLFRFTIIRERLIGINREKQAEGIEII